MSFLRTLIVALGLASVAVAQAAGDEQRLNELHSAVVTEFNNKNYDRALELSNKTLALTINMFGPGHLATAVVYSDLGSIYREQRNFTSSVENFKKSIEIYESLMIRPGAKLLAAYESLANVQSLAGKKKDAVETFTKAVSFAEGEFGYYSKEAFSPTLNLANLIAAVGEYDEADKLYIKSHIIAYKNFGVRSSEVEMAGDYRTCQVSLNRPDFKYLKAFQDSLDSELKSIIPSKGIVNGKVRDLVKPVFPPELKLNSGVVAIKVNIDKGGNVVDAWRLCGDSRFAPAAIAAALKTKFDPTYDQNGPQRVVGTITYKFSN